MRMLDDLGAPERDLKEEPQRRDGLIDCRHADATLRQMQLVAAHVLETRRIRRSSEKRREVLDPLHIVMPGLRRELADRHVFDHAPAQRAHCLIGHGDAPVLSEVVATPQSQDRTPPGAIGLAAPPAAATYRASGLVHWHETDQSTGSDYVCSYGKTGSDRRIVKSTRLTLKGSSPCDPPSGDTRSSAQH